MGYFTPSRLKPPLSLHIIRAHLMGSKNGKRVKWDSIIDEAVRELKPQLDLLREHDRKARASRPARA